MAKIKSFLLLILPSLFLFSVSISSIQNITDLFLQQEFNSFHCFGSATKRINWPPLFVFSYYKTFLINLPFMSLSLSSPFSLFPSMTVKLDLDFICYFQIQWNGIIPRITTHFLCYNGMGKNVTVTCASRLHLLAK